MPRYRVTVWSVSRPNLRQQKIINKRSIRNAVSDTTLLAAKLQLRGKLSDSDIRWSVERLSGHLNSWVIAASNTHIKVSDHAAAN